MCIQTSRDNPKITESLGLYMHIQKMWGGVGERGKGRHKGGGAMKQKVAPLLKRIIYSTMVHRLLSFEKVLFFFNQKKKWSIFIRIHRALRD